MSGLGPELWCSMRRVPPQLAPCRGEEVLHRGRLIRGRRGSAGTTADNNCRCARLHEQRSLACGAIGPPWGPFWRCLEVLSTKAMTRALQNSTGASAGSTPPSGLPQLFRASCKGSRRLCKAFWDGRQAVS